MAGYTMDFLDGVVIEVDHLRWDRNEMWGRVAVYCDWKQARVYRDECDPKARPLLHRADLNFSTARSRQDRAKILKQRSGSEGKLDWDSRMERFCYHVFDAVEKGEPMQDVWEYPETSPHADDYTIGGVMLPKKHPAILFGDGGAMKSYLCLYFAGQLAFQGANVGFYDWELNGEEHRRRCSRMFGSCPQRPRILYCHCQMPVAREFDRIMRSIRDYKIQYGFFDSLSFAAKPGIETSEAAIEYFQAVREFDIGSTHVAHINKTDQGDQKPFGSSFWHNGARATWYCRIERSTPAAIRLSLFQRKANCGPLCPPTGFDLRFTEKETLIDNVAIQDNPSTNAKEIARSRIKALLEKTARHRLTYVEIAEVLGLRMDIIQKTVTSEKAIFRIVTGGNGEQDQVALV